MIRAALREDFPAVWALAKALYAAQGMFRLREDKARAAIAAAVDAGRCLVAEAGGIIVGYAAYRIGADWYSDEQVMTDMGLFVDPAHRRSRAALGLLNAMKREARARGLRFLPGCGGKTQESARLFARGFKQVGITFEAK